MSNVPSLYRRYLLLCSKWPVDDSKAGRDYGIHIRETYNKIFSKGDITTLTTQQIRHLEKQFDSLERLERNIYYTPVFYKVTSTGLTGQECREVTSTEFLKQMKLEYNKSFVDKVTEIFANIKYRNTKDEQQ